MAFDEVLAQHVRALLAGTAGLSEKKSLGTLSFLVNGNMGVGLHGGELIVRIDPTANAGALQQPGVRIFVSTGQPLKGWLLVGGSALAPRKALAKWVKLGLDFASSLPAK